MVAALLENGVRVDLLDHEGNTALLLAVATGSVEVIEFLLRKGADIDAVDSHGRSALDIAKEKRHWAVGDLLVSRRPSRPRAPLGQPPVPPAT